MRIAIMVSLLTGTACGHKDTAPAPAAARPVPWLALTIDVPADARLEPGKTGDDFAVLSWSGVHLSINAHTNTLFHKDLATAVASAQTDGKITKQGATADGWEVRYDEEIAGDAVHFVVIHRRIAEVEWECTGGGESPQAAESVVTACASLRAP